MNQLNQLNDQKMLSGKVALITGSGGGLGKAIGLSLLEAGASVVLTDLLLQEEDASKDKVPRNRHPLVFKMDVTRPEQISKVVDEVTERLGVVDILVNNAVMPGFIETEIVKSHRPEILERVKNVTAMKRLGRPEEVTALVVFLASEFSSYMTGTAIPVTGGADLFVF